MKFLLTIAISTALFASVEFKEAKDFKRVMPKSSNDVVLSYYSAIKDAKKSVVNISTEKHIKGVNRLNPYNPFFDFFGDFMVPKERVQRALGSGVIITENGYIVTNNHVIESADKILVTLADSKIEYSAKVIGSDKKSDLAIIKIEAEDLEAIEFANSDLLREGDIVFAIGNPFGVGETTTQGIVSALNKSGMGINDYENFIQTDASINPGNSGGALIDSRGVLVGINTAIISRSGGNEGVGFAIPSNMVKQISKSLIEQGKVERGYLGVVIGDLTKELREFYGESQKGALVLSVEDDTPAKEIGIKRGDLIIEIDGVKVEDSAELKNIIGQKIPNQKVNITVLRDDREIEFKVNLATQELDSENLIDGVTLQDLTPDIRAKFRLSNSLEGVAVVSVEDRVYGFLEGDVIVQVESFPTSNLKELREALKSYQNSKKRVFVNRRGFIYILVID